VGALTSKPYAFTARPWELRRYESVDVMDGVGSNIMVQTRTGEVMRIVPQENDDINEEWISDKTRFAYDGLKRQRLTEPYITDSAGEMKAERWVTALPAVASLLSNVDGNEVAAVSGDFTDAETLFTMRGLLHKFDSELLMTEESFPLSGPGTDFRSSYLFNTGIADIEDADAILLIGTNPRFEAPIVNTRIRKTWRQSDAKIATVGLENVDLTYPVQYLGQDTATLESLANGTHPFCEVLQKASNPIIIAGSSVLERADGGALQSTISKIVEQTSPEEGWKVFNVLQRKASQTAALDLGYKAGIQDLSQVKVLFLLGADGGKVSRDMLHPDCKVVYIGSHGDAGASIADYILPGAAYTEKSAIYVNTEGRAQQTQKAISPPGVAREDWKIIRALSEIAGAKLPFDKIEDLRWALQTVAPHLLRIGEREEANFFKEAFSLYQSTQGSLSAEPLSAPINKLQDFYMTDSISRASQTMANCVKATQEMN